VQNNTDIYITNVPVDLPEAAIADALRDCLPVRIKLSPAVNPEDRLKPDQFYDWMPRSGECAADLAITVMWTELHADNQVHCTSPICIVVSTFSQCYTIPLTI
jgi:hypothetical protein